MVQDMTFQQFLMATRRSFLAAVEHSDVPFTKMVELANVTPSQSYTPIFQAVVSFKEYSAIARESSDMGVSFNPFMLEVMLCSLIPGIFTLICCVHAESAKCCMHDVFLCKDPATLQSWQNPACVSVLSAVHASG